MASYDFKFLSVKPAGGWTARTLRSPSVNTTVDSSVGPVNALAQNQVTAAQLRTTPSTLYDTSLGSRQYQNPNTGIRNPVAASSVYAQSDVPAFLSQSVDALNAEQALRRALQSEWQNRLLQETSSGTNPYLFAEALRAASVNPGASVAFGQQIADPNVGRGFLAQSNAASALAQEKARALSSNVWEMSRLANSQSALSSKSMNVGGAAGLTNNADIIALQRDIQARNQAIAMTQPVRQAIAASPTTWAVAPSAGSSMAGRSNVYAPSGWW